MSYMAVVSCANILQLREERHDANDIGIIVASEIAQAVTNRRKMTKSTIHRCAIRYLVVFLENLAESSVIKILIVLKKD